MSDEAFYLRLLNECPEAVHSAVPVHFQQNPLQVDPASFAADQSIYDVKTVILTRSLNDESAYRCDCGQRDTAPAQTILFHHWYTPDSSLSAPHW